MQEPAITPELIEAHGLKPDEYERICMIRRVLSEMNPPDAMEMLVTRLKKTKTNAEFFNFMKR